MLRALPSEQSGLIEDISSLWVEIFRPCLERV